MQYSVVIEKTDNGYSAYAPDCQAASPLEIRRSKWRN